MLSRVERSIDTLASTGGHGDTGQWSPGGTRGSLALDTADTPQRGEDRGNLYWSQAAGVVVYCALL